MTAEVHAELAKLVGRFRSEDILEEEWALFQIHMSYCADCENAFLALQSTAGSLSQPKSFN